MKKSLAYNLIESLIEQSIIKEGITIPYLMGAYKIKDQDTTPVTLDYIRAVFYDIIEHDENKFWIKTCSNVDNHKTISIIDTELDKDILTNKQYKNICNQQGIPSIYFEEYFECPNPTLDNISTFFWAQYKEACFIPMKYSYAAGKWSDISEKEIIKKL